jgi:hypothetical protein
MRRLLLALLLIGAAGCAGESGEVSGPAQGNNRPQAAESETVAPSAEAAPAPKFGQTFTFENGLAVTVGVPQPFTPSETAAAEEAPAYVSFPVTVVNGSNENYDPVLFNATLQSSNVEAAQVFDSEQGINGPPATTLLPGRESAFQVVFGVADPADLVLEVTPGFEYESAIFTN